MLTCIAIVSQRQAFKILCRSISFHVIKAIKAACSALTFSFVETITADMKKDQNITSRKKV